MATEYLTKKQMFDYVESLWEDAWIFYIAIKGIKDKKLARKLQNLGASYSLEDNYNHMEGNYSFLYHVNWTSQLQFMEILEKLKDMKILWKKFKIETYSKSEHEKNVTRRLKEEKEQKELRKIYKPSVVITKTIRNDLTENVYRFYIDKKNKLFTQTYWNALPSPQDKIYRYKNLDQFK